MKQTLRLAAILLAVTAVMAALLAAVNLLTRDPIALAKQEKTAAAIRAVLPDAASPETVPFEDPTGLVRTLYRTEGGYAVETAPAGFGGEMVMMVGIAPDGSILGLQIVSHAETPSLGAVAAADSAAGEAFRGQFRGLTAPVAVTADGGNIDALTNATITSRAVTEGVNAAIECVLRREAAQ